MYECAHLQINEKLGKLILLNFLQIVPLKNWIIVQEDFACFNYSIASCKEVHQEYLLND